MRPRRFREERQAFQQLRETLRGAPELREEVEIALREVLRSFPTTIRENRFVVGGVIEVILVAAFRASGIPAADVGPRADRVDIESGDRRRLFCEGAFRWERRHPNDQCPR